MRIDEVGASGKGLINCLLCFAEFALALQDLTKGDEGRAGFGLDGESLIDLHLAPHPTASASNGPEPSGREGQQRRDRE